MQFDHIGVVVKTLKRGRDMLGPPLQIRAWTREWEDPVNKVHVQFGYDPSGVCYELIAPLGEESPVALALKTKSRILNHVAYLVEDLAAEGERLRDAHCLPIAEPQPAIAYGGRPIQFFMSPLSVIIELIEAPGHRHQILPPG
ncbi:VOC family protein [Roseomonas sp. E05]|uniref:VOC family protein n=1 Tax=Roseomonas sp. E05 TaxID=3046310 RepID=UPI0024BB77C0|nr:VOC family protein [Roseomonas sp. E05]MDJ0387856.1 VOC family protein [Roseomonas sp. E05]